MKILAIAQSTLERIYELLFKDGIFNSIGKHNPGLMHESENAAFERTKVRSELSELLVSALNETSKTLKDWLSTEGDLEKSTYVKNLIKDSLDKINQEFPDDHINAEPPLEEGRHLITKYMPKGSKELRDNLLYTDKYLNYLQKERKNAIYALDLLDEAQKEKNFIKKTVAFQAALSTIHNDKKMSQNLVDNGQAFLSFLSNHPKSAKWEEDVAKLFGRLQLSDVYKMAKKKKRP
jgi:hypothetical protein